MSTVRAFPASEQETRYVNQAKALISQRLPGQDFDSAKWDASALRKRRH
jgi:hypothetical protein